MRSISAASAHAITVAKGKGCGTAGWCKARCAIGASEPGRQRTATTTDSTSSIKAGGAMAEKVNPFSCASESRTKFSGKSRPMAARAVFPGAPLARGREREVGSDQSRMQKDRDSQEPDGWSQERLHSSLALTIIRNLYVAGRVLCRLLCSGYIWNWAESN